MKQSLGTQAFIQRKNSSQQGNLTFANEWTSLSARFVFQKGVKLPERPLKRYKKIDDIYCLKCILK